MEGRIRGAARANPSLDRPRTTAAEWGGLGTKARVSVMILPQVHLRKPCYDFYFL